MKVISLFLALMLIFMGSNAAGAEEAVAKPAATETLQAADSAEQVASQPNEPITATPEDVIKAYQNNSDLANQTYLGQRIKLTGVVNQIDKNDQGEPFVAFSISQKDLYARAYFPEKTGVPASIKIGQSLTIICTFRDIDSSDVNFIDCSM